MVEQQTGCCEDSGAIAPAVAVDELDSVIKSWHVQADKHWAKDLLLVAVHGGGDVSEDGGAKPVTLGIPRHSHVAAINKNLTVSASMIDHSR